MSSVVLNEEQIARLAAHNGCKSCAEFGDQKTCQQCHPDDSDDDSIQESECERCGGSYPWEGCGQAVIMGCCEGEGCQYNYENLCGYCSTYDEENEALLCIECDKKAHPADYASESDSE